MPLDYKAKFKFNALAKRLMLQLTAEELNAMTIDALLEKILEPVTAEVRLQKIQLTKLFQSLRNPQEEQRAYELKTQFEASDIFTLYSYPKEELRELLSHLVLQNEQNSALISNSIFNHPPEREDERTIILQPQQ